MKRVGEIETDPHLAGMFTIRAETLASVIASMKESGYDKSQPIVLWKGEGVVVDGHTRLQAAREVGIAEVPVEEKEFASLDDAKLYAYRRQAERRNLTPAEILAAAMELQPKDARDGAGRASEILAKNLGVSPSTVKHAQAVAHKASPEIIDEVKKNRMSINKAYRLTKGKPEKPAKVQPEPEPDREEPSRECDGHSVSSETHQSSEWCNELDNDRLERLELWVHRENIHIPAGDDPRLEAARSMLRTLNGFAVPDEFAQDVHAMLQALFQTDIDEQAEPELPGDLADPDLWGAGNEE
jgi:ParB-like chromosome segregation protein Spo0J